MSMKTLKKLLLLVMTLAVLVGTVFAVSAFAEDTEATTPEDSGAGESTVEPTVLYVNSTGDPLEDGTTAYLWNDALGYVNEHAAEGAFKIVLLENVTVDAKFTFTASVNLTIDLAGNTLTASADVIFLGDNSSNSVFTLITSTAGGKVDAAGSLFTISGQRYDKDSLCTFNFCGEGSEALTLTAYMLVETATSAFKEDMTANINIDGGDYKFTFAFYQVTGSESPVSATYHVNAKNAAIRGKGQFIFQNKNRTVEKQNPASTISFTNCTLAYSSTSSPSTRAVPFSNSDYMGSISMTRCEIQAFVFNEKVSKAKSIELSEGCKFNGSYTKAMTTTLNEDKTAFNQTNVSIPDGCYLYQSKDGSVCVLNNERVLQVSNETNYEAGTYTWNDALSFVENYYNATDVLTVRLTEDIFVGEEFNINKPVKLTIDLAGYTLSSNTGSVKTDSEGKQSWNAGVTVKLGSGSSNCVITTMTSVEGGTWNNVYKNSLNNATSYDSLFSISSGVSPLTFNFGGAGSEALTVNGNMLVTGSSTSFKDDKIVDLHIDGGSYKLTNGIFQIKADSSMTSCAIYNADVKNATLSVNSRLLYRNGSGSSLNPESIMSFTNCTLKSWSKAIGCVNTKYQGTFTMTRCTIENLVFDWSMSEAKVVIGEGCLFKTPDATYTPDSGTYEGITYTTFNEDKTGFANANITWTDDCDLIVGKSNMPFTMKKDLTLPVSQNEDVSRGSYDWSYALTLVSEFYEAGAFKMVLLEDITVTAQKKISVPVKLTIDLAGKTVTVQEANSKDALSVTASKAEVTIMTSEEGGKWDNSPTESGSPFVLGEKSGNVITFGGENSKPLTVRANMLVENGSRGFTDNEIVTINIYGGTYTLDNGFYQVMVGQNDAEETQRVSAAIHKVVAEDATIYLNDHLFYIHGVKDGENVPLNAASSMTFTNCTIRGNGDDPAGLASSSKYGNYQGTIKAYGCYLRNLKFDERAKDATSIVFDKDCTYKDIVLGEGFVGAYDNDGSIHIMLDTEACYVRFNTPIGNEKKYWVVGSTPKYKGTKTLTINDHEYTITFPNVSEVTTAGESYTYNCKLSGGVKLQTSLTLYSGIDLNVYVPAWAEIEKINGQLVTEFSTVTNGDTVYYKVPFTLAPKNAGETQTVSIVVKYNDQSVALEAREVSVVDYVNKLAALYPNSETSELALSLLAYAKETRLYFYDIDAEEGDEVTKAIDTVLAEHEYSVTEWTAEGNTNIKELPTGLQYIKAMALTLGDTPGVSVAVLEGVEAVTIAGVTYTVDPTKTTTVEGITCCYVDAEFGAFAMMDDFVIEANGEMITINLDTYLYRVDAPSYAGALYGYVSAAKAYITK